MWRWSISVVMASQITLPHSDLWHTKLMFTNCHISWKFCKYKLQDIFAIFIILSFKLCVLQVVCSRGVENVLILCAWSMKLGFWHFAQCMLQLSGKVLALGVEVPQIWTAQGQKISCCVCFASWQGTYIPLLHWLKHFWYLSYVRNITIEVLTRRALRLLQSWVRQIDCDDFLMR